jgi:hypothetical protein
VYPSCQNIVSRCSQRLQGWHRSASKRGLAYRPAQDRPCATSGVCTAVSKKENADCTVHDTQRRNRAHYRRRTQLSICINSAWLRDAIVASCSVIDGLASFRFACRTPRWLSHLPQTPHISDRYPFAGCLQLRLCTRGDSVLTALCGVFGS